MSNPDKTATPITAAAELVDAGTVPTVNLDEIGKNPLEASRFGVWYLKGKIVEDLLAAAEDALAMDEEIATAVEDGRLNGAVTCNRGRRNINLHLAATSHEGQANKNEIISTTTRQLQKRSESTSVAVSLAIEEWLQLESGTLSNAHKEKSSSVVRLLKYSESTATPPHADAAGYVLRIAKDTMEVQDPDNSNKLWEIPPLHGTLPAPLPHPTCIVWLLVVSPLVYLKLARHIERGQGKVMKIVWQGSEPSWSHWASPFRCYGN